jgi:SPP1 gp7 family putative phage head morphogenesis protein
MDNANTVLHDKLVDRAATMRLYERRLVSDIDSIIGENQREAADVIKTSDLSASEQRALFKKLDVIRERQRSQTINMLSRGLVELFSDQVSFMYQSVESVFGRLFKVNLPSYRLAEEVVLSRPLATDMTLQKGWDRLTRAEKIRAESLIRRGVAEGKSVEEISYQVRRGHVHDMTRLQSRGLVVTSMTSIASQADQQLYAANADVLEGYQYIAVLDTRTSAICASRDGKIFDVDDVDNLPPAHFFCRSRTTPIFKSWEGLAKSEALGAVASRNTEGLTASQKLFYDGMVPKRVGYSEWLSRQQKHVKLRHLGTEAAVRLFETGKLSVDRFSSGNKSLSLAELRRISSQSNTVDGDVSRFDSAKQMMDQLKLSASRPDDIINDKTLQRTLADYYELQSRDLDGLLSLTNYRGQLIATKAATKKRVLQSPPRDDQVRFNPMTGRYEDSRMYQPNMESYNSGVVRLNSSDVLKPEDKEFIINFVEGLSDRMGLNERAVVMDNLRIVFGRFRENGEPWSNLKAVLNSQIKYDVVNISASMEINLRKNTDLIKRLKEHTYIDPVLGPANLNELQDSLVDNIILKNKWEDKKAPKVASKLRGIFDTEIALAHPTIWGRLSNKDIQQFYLRFAHRLSLGDSPDRDQLAVTLGRDLFNQANYNGSRKEWYELGLKLLSSDRAKSLYDIETFGVQKRRMKSRMSGAYFGPYYDTVAYNIRITDPVILEYTRLSRKVELGMRVPSVSGRQLLVREGYKTYFVDRGVLGFYDTRIPITSTSSFSEFPEKFVSKDFAESLNWAGASKYRIDEDYFDFVKTLLYFEDDRGKAKYFNELNGYRSYMAGRGDAYERLKAAEWLREGGREFSNVPFIDHRARIYDRGLIGPQAGETFRPFLNTANYRNFSEEEFFNFQDQIGSFLGGLSDVLERPHNSLTKTGRQKIALKWRDEMINVGEAAIRRKPADIRYILESKLVQSIDGEEQGKFFRLAMELAKMKQFLMTHSEKPFSKSNLKNLSKYKTRLALEQDASSSGAQIIALTTRNKQLAELSNVIPTDYKKRLYDEIAAKTFYDPRFVKLNERLQLSEKDLKKAAKAQNMVTFYGAGERTGVFNVEGKLGKSLSKDSNTLVVKAADRDTVLNEISAQAARYDRFDPETAASLRALRRDVRDVFNKGIDPGDEIMEQLYFLSPQTRELVEKLSRNYSRVVTPDDFKEVAMIMSEYLASEVPILKDFTRFFGRLAEDFLYNAKPSKSDFEWSRIGKLFFRDQRKKGYIPPKWVSSVLGEKSGTPLDETILKKFSFFKPGSALADVLLGVSEAETRRTGGKYFKMKALLPATPTPSNLLKGVFLKEVSVVKGVELFFSNKLPKSWTNVPWVNFEGKVIEQNFTQVFEERLVYRDVNGNWTTNILQVPQKTSASWVDEALNDSGKINDIADVTKARTAFGVNGNHSNDAVIVKEFHKWGRENGVPTSTIHDAFFTNASDMLKAREALRKIYAEMLKKNVIVMTLDEMRARGLPKELYKKYMSEAIEKGLIPIPGVSRINGRLLKTDDILKPEDILKKVPQGFDQDYGWYGVG